MFAAGWAQTDITPDRPVDLVGQMHRRISQGVRDPITATALAMEFIDRDEKRRQSVMISCDLLYIETHVLEKVRRRLREILPGLDPEKIFIAATHTHTAPFTSKHHAFVLERQEPGPVMDPDDYTDFLVARLIGAVVEAWKGRVESATASALGYAVTGQSRRVLFADGHAEMYGDTNRSDFIKLDGGSDQGIEMLFFFRDDKVSGVIVNVACPSQVIEHHSVISADYWSVVRRILREQLGSHLHILPFISATGDQSPSDLIRKDRKPDMYGESGLEELGRRVADCILREAKDARIRKEPVRDLHHVMHRIDLPLRTVDDQEVEAARRWLTQMGFTPDLSLPDFLKEGIDRIALFDAKGILRRAQEQQSNRLYAMELHGVRLGNCAFITNPFELFQEFGMRIKAMSPAQSTIVVQLACHAAGYLPTQAGVVGGGYSTKASNGFCGPNAGEVLVTKSLSLLHHLFHRPAAVGTTDRSPPPPE